MAQVDLYKVGPINKKSHDRRAVHQRTIHQICMLDKNPSVPGQDTFVGYVCTSDDICMCILTTAFKE